MRPIAVTQNPLRYPLNDLLGTQAHVRLLRVMANEVDGPVTASDIAKRSGLTLPGAQKALRKLYKSGFIVPVGGGKNHQYEIRRSDKLLQIVLELFQEEKVRYDQLITAIKNVVKSHKPHPHAVWIQDYPIKVGEPLSLGLLHETRHLTNCTREVRKHLNQVEKDFDYTIEINGYTKADISELKFKDFTPLYGTMPIPDNSIIIKSETTLTHKEKNRQLDILSIKLAKAIEKDTSLIRRAKEHIDRILKEDQGMAYSDILEWHDILEMYSIQRLSQFLISSSERANRLRQSNPFFAILNPDEQALLLNSKEIKNDP